MPESQENTPQQGLSNGSPATLRFKVALSFAGDNKRDKIREIVNKLTATLGADDVFFDEDYEHEFAGLNAYRYFQNVFNNETLLVVSCICKRYSQKDWTQHEWRAIMSFASSNCQDDVGRNRFLPIRFDADEIDEQFKGLGLFSNLDVVPDVSSRSCEEISGLILARYQICANDVVCIPKKITRRRAFGKKSVFVFLALVLSVVAIVCGLIWWNWPREELRQWNLEKDLASKIAKDLHDNQSVLGSQMLVNQRGQFAFSLTSDASEAFIGRDFTIRFDDDPQTVTVEFNMNGTFDVSKFQAYAGKSVNVKGTIGKIEKISPLRASVNFEAAAFTDLPANP